MIEGNLRLEDDIKCYRGVRNRSTVNFRILGLMRSVGVVEERGSILLLPMN